jgi:hypothetical protein
VNKHRSPRFHRDQPVGRLRPVWVDNIKMVLVKLGYGVVDCVGLAWVREGQVRHGSEPSGSTECWETVEWLHD